MPRVEARRGVGPAARSARSSRAALLAAPAFVQGQSPLTVRFVQQRGLLYIPVDVMVSGGILQQEATKLGLGKVDATATALSGPGPELDALLSGAADYGTAALPSLLTRVGAHARQRQTRSRAVGAVSNGAMTLYTINPNAGRFWRAGSHCRAHRAPVLQRHDAANGGRAAMGRPASPRPLDCGTRPPPTRSRRYRPVMARRQSRRTSACSPSRNAA
jgi:hypothetical protein